MKSLLIALAAVFLIIFSGCKKDESQIPQPKPLTLTEKAGEVIAQSNRFGIDLFTATAASEESNLMLSPLSASTAITMLLNGCGGQTYEQIRQMLGFEGMTIDEINAAYQSLTSQLLTVDPDVKLALANAVWYRNWFQVKQPFLDTMADSFSAKVEALDFDQPEALTTINGWASDNTYGKITKVLDAIDPQAVMFLMNALYFKGTWTYQFQKDLTGPGEFYLDDGTIINVQMMKSKFPVKTIGGSDYSAIEMPYGRQNFAMVVIVPAGTLDNFIADFNDQAWIDITGLLDAITESTESEVFMPKFKFDFEKVLNDQLKSMGMIDAFNPDLADLTGISDDDIFVSFVKQNTFVEVNEEGTEAAAVTTIGIDLTSIGSSFAVNKPFIFIIRERTTNTILFIGKVVNPQVDDL